MTNRQALDELDLIIALQQSVLERSYMLRKEIQSGVSTPDTPQQGKKKKDFTHVQAMAIASRRKSINDKRSL